MTSPALSGVVYGSLNGTGPVHLPLEEMRVDALIVDISVRVVLTQVFLNNLSSPSPRAKYVFPVPSGAAVCAFQMCTSDDRLIIGVAKEKNKASKEHKEAVLEGKETALVEWVSDDIFTISLGSIGPGEVTTTLTYVMDLMDGDISSRVRFQIPLCVGQRYGDLPAGMIGAAQAGAGQRIRIKIDAKIQTKGLVRSVSSPSHPTLTVAHYQTHHGRPSRHRMTARFRSRTFLEQDFVLLIEAIGLDAPRCFMEFDNRTTGSESVAMQLVLMPKFNLPPIRQQEYIFLVDRSGSMDGARIESAKRTLIMLLRGLPTQGIVFNIFSFGDETDGFWKTNKTYSQVSLAQATRHVDSMKANYGGTRICKALETTCGARNRMQPTVIFLLTDGEAHDIDATVGVVTHAVQQSTPNAPLRVFTLGIGETTSTAMCEGIARAGNGVCLMAATPESIVGKCSKLLRAGKTFLLKNISIDWGIPSDLQGSDHTASHVVPFTSLDQTMWQTPSHIGALYPGTRLIIFALIKSDRFTPPNEIYLRAQRDGTGDELKFSVPVEIVKFEEENSPSLLVHTLAARRLITELEDESRSQMMPDSERAASIIKLGERYQLASRYTSFVAVEAQETDSSQTPLPPGVVRPRPHGSHSPHQSSRNNKIHWQRKLDSYLQRAFGYVGGFVSAFIDTWVGPPPENLHSHSVPGGDLHSRPGSPIDYDVDEDDGEGDETDRTFTTLSSILGHSDSEWSEAESRAASPIADQKIARSQSPAFARAQTAPAPTQGGDQSVPLPPVDDNVVNLVRLQSFDGSFSPDDSFKGIVGINAMQEGQSLGLDPDLWATILAIAYFQKHLSNQPELRDSLAEKAREFALARLPSGTDFASLVKRAELVLQ